MNRFNTQINKSGNESMLIVFGLGNGGLISEIACQRLNKNRVFVAVDKTSHSVILPVRQADLR